MNHPTTGTAEQRPPLRIAVLASGNGSNLQAIIDAIAQGSLTGVELVCVLSDKVGCRALDRAATSGIVGECFPISDFAAGRAARDAAMAKRLETLAIDLVVLAGYMQILSRDFIAAFANRIINVHPSLLPKYPGLDAIGQAIAAGDNQTGVTVHYVDDGIDTGPVIAQESLPISPGDNTESLAERLHVIEHRLLPSVIAKIAEERR